jgi:hypothetical protein
MTIKDDGNIGKIIGGGNAGGRYGEGTGMRNCH